jgi:hypothetical protein
LYEGAAVVVAEVFVAGGFAAGLSDEAIAEFDAAAPVAAITAFIPISAHAERNRVVGQ